MTPVTPSPPRKRQRLMAVSMIPHLPPEMIMRIMSFLPLFPYYFWYQRISKSFHKSCQELVQNQYLSNQEGFSQRIVITLDLLPQYHPAAGRSNGKSKKQKQEPVKCVSNDEQQESKKEAATSGEEEKNTTVAPSKKKAITSTLLHNIFLQCKNATELEFRDVALDADTLNLVLSHTYSFKRLYFVNVELNRCSVYNSRFHPDYESLFFVFTVENRYGRGNMYQFVQLAEEDPRAELLINRSSFMNGLLHTWDRMDPLEQMMYCMKRFIHHRIYRAWSLSIWAEEFFYDLNLDSPSPFQGSLVLVFSAVKPLIENKMVDVTESITQGRYTLAHMIMEQIICKCPCLKPENNIPMETRYKNWYNSSIVQDAKEGLRYLIQDKHFQPLSHKETHVKATILDMARYLDREVSQKKMPDAFQWEEYLLSLMPLKDQEKWRRIGKTRNVFKQDFMEDWTESQG